MGFYPWRREANRHTGPTTGHVTERPETTEKDNIAQEVSGLSVLSELSVTYGSDSEIIARAITATQYWHPWTEAVFNFARHLKPWAESRRLPFGALQEAVRAWHEVARPAEAYFDETWEEFGGCWARIKAPVGSGVLDRIKPRVANTDYWPTNTEYSDPRTLKLLALAAELAKESKGGVFFMTCRVAARLCGFRDHMTAARRIAMLVRDGWLRIEVDATKTRGARYRLCRSLVRPCDPAAGNGPD